MTAEPPERLDFLPWEYSATASDKDRARQVARRSSLAGTVELAPDAFVAESAAVFCDRLEMGERSYIAAHAYVTGKITLGADTTINPYAVVRGRITLGDGVRIGAHASLIAFNHGTAPDRPIFQQPHTALGITVGDDVWIGSNVIIVDGVTIGPHSIIGAGAVVTKDVEEWSVMVGNPARKIRDRRTTEANPTKHLSDRLAAFATRAREQTSVLLKRCYDGERFVDRPGLDHPPTIRPWCDAIEISDLLLRRTPDGHTRDDLVRRLRPLQDDSDLLQGPTNYHVLCVGYALQLLGSCFERRIDTAFTEDQLAQLPWARNAWSAGAGIDALGTAIARNLNDHSDPGPLATLMGWLTLNADPATGMWGQPDPDNGWLQVVNGFYRLTRGTYAQFGLPLPYPEATIKTVLTHTQDSRHFTGNAYNACNVLDVIHPLWLAAKQTDFARAEGQRWAEHQLTTILDHWTDGAGFAFAPNGSDDHAIPGLQGTEMWLAIIWLLADYLGHSDALAYHPRGVHRPEPLLTTQRIGVRT
ncbi:acyltransferase [Kribbella sp. NPDC006257]|uniref:acyltransferase n=1 Tax=Kribbella sp. NPDC006257 TaxID=3156738 RepID=UPI0033B96A90